MLRKRTQGWKCLVVIKLPSRSLKTVMKLGLLSPSLECSVSQSSVLSVVKHNDEKGNQAEGTIVAPAGTPAAFFKFSQDESCEAYAKKLCSQVEVLLSAYPLHSRAYDSCVNYCNVSRSGAGHHA